MITDSFIAITTVIFEHIVAQTDTTDRIISNLKRFTGIELDPEQRAFCNALKEAWKEFKDIYPLWEANEFNFSFMEREGAPILAKFLLRIDGPYPSELAEAWIKSIRKEVDGKSYQDQQDAIPVAKFLLDTLENKLKQEKAFLNIIRDRSQEAIQQDVQQIKEFLTPSLKVKYINFVIFAMTKNEAKELISKRIFTNARNDPERKAYQELKKLLKRHKITNEDLLKFYGNGPEEWRLPLSGSLTVRDAITSEVEIFSAQPASDRSISPKFCSKDFRFGSNDSRSNTWKMLENNCIIIVDAISLFHPELVKRLLGSGFVTKSHVPMLILSPIVTDMPPINQLLKHYMETEVIGLSHALFRFEMDLDMLCEFGVGNEIAFKRWLHSTLKHMPRPSSPNSDAMWQAASNKKSFEQTSPDISSHLFGKN